MKQLRLLLFQCMKISLVQTFLACVFMGVSWANDLSAQELLDRRVSLQVSDKKLKPVLKEIEKIADVRFSYTPQVVHSMQLVSLKASNVTLGEVLERLLKPLNVNYDISGKQIILTRAIPVGNTIKVEAQEEDQPKLASLKGKITDEKGEALPGVSVQLKGTTAGTSSNADGEFSLETNATSGVLIFSFVGYVSKEIQINGQTNFEVSLEPSVNSLNAVIVVAYGSESRATQTSAVSNLKAAAISNIPTSQMSTSLAGRLPGAQIIQNSGFVGASARISVRGSSISPLYVIDNIVSDKSQFDVLDPSEVESISLLKDAAAAAIYGARASGGVLVVKTKTGKPGKVVVNYRGMFSTNRTIYPLQDWTPEQEVIFRNDVALSQNRLSANPNPNFVVPFDQAAIDYAKTIKSQNINDILWRNPASQQHSVDVSGGSDKVLYFFSANYNNNTGSYDNTNFNKYTVRAKVDANVSKNLRIGTNFSYNRRYTSRFFWPYDNDNGEGFTVADFYRPTFNLSHLYPYYSKADGTPTTASDPGAYPTIQPGWGFNPAETVNSVNYRNIAYNTFNAIFTAELDIPQIQGLSLRLLGDYRQDNFFRKDFIGEFNRSYRVQPLGTSGIDLLKLGPLKFDANNTVVNNYGRSFTSILENVSLSERYQVNAFVDYVRSFGKHNISSFVGLEQSKFGVKSLSGSANELLTSNNDQILSASTAAERRTFSGGELNQARLSYFGRAKYDFANKYIAEFSFREDGSYIFAQGKQFGFFPSASAGWVASKESFFKVKQISTLKLRGSYGTTGYDGLDGTTTNIAPYQFQNNYNVNGSYVFANGVGTGLAPQGTVPNPNITWAINKTLNFGTDIGLFNDALSLTFDYFTTKRSRILVSSVELIPGTFGTGLPATNIGEQKAKGFEFSLNYANSIGKLSYSVGFNVGYAIDQYVKWPQLSTVQDFQKLVGKPTSGVVIGYISKGIVRDQKTIEALPAGFTQFGRPVQLGVVLIEDLRGDAYAPGANGKIDANDQTVISTNAVPRTNFGLPIDLKWNDFTLNLFFQGVGPYDKFVSTLNTAASGGVFQQTDRPYFELWTDAYSQDHNPNGKYPRASGYFSDADMTGSSTTFWKRNGAYMRFKNVNIGYSIPKKIVNVIGLNHVQLNLNATNLFTISSFKEHDPEQSSLDSYPIFRTYSFGVNVSF